MSATASTGAMEFLSQKLKASADVTALLAGRMYNSMAPEGTVKPYLIVQQMSFREDGTSIDGQLGAARLEVMLKAVTEGNSYASAEAILKAVHAAVHGQTGTVDGVTVRSCIRSGGPVFYAEADNSKRYNHFGYTYLMFVTEGG